jgi:ribosomal subunit interface protein
MNLTVKGKQLDVGDALRTHCGERLEAVTSKYFGDAIEATVVLSREAHLYRADLSMHVGRNIQMNAGAEAGDPYVAVDGAVDRLAKRLRRYKRRLRDHHREETAPPIAAQAYVLQGAPADEAEADGAEADGAETDEAGDDQPIVIAEMTTPVETLTVTQAVMRLDLAELPALMFRNPAHGGLNMVYRRPDGHVGWVDPRGTRESGA